MNMPLVSVIVPTYNGAKRITKTLQSIIDQDYENLEIIFVNDGSTDNTLSAAEDVLKKSGRIFKIISHEKNRGVSAARNTGLKIASGKYVCFCDGDDLVAKNYASSLCREAEDKSADLVFCERRYDNEVIGKSEYEHIDSKKITFSKSNEYLKAWAENRIYFWSVWNFIFYKKLLIENNIRFTEGCSLGEDTEFVMKALCVASKISFTSDTFYIYIHHSEHQSTNFTSVEQHLQAFRHMMLSKFRIGRFIIRHTDSKKVKNYVLNFYIPDTIIKNITVSIKDKNRGRYNRAVMTLKHKKIREILLSTSKFILKKPELFFKALMVLYFPNLYYTIRRKNENSKSSATR